MTTIHCAAASAQCN